MLALFGSVVFRYLVYFIKMLYYNHQENFMFLTWLCYIIVSGRIPCPHPGRIWLEQRGLQRALYWHIEARVVLDLQEVLNSVRLFNLNSMRIWILLLLQMPYKHDYVANTS